MGTLWSKSFGLCLWIDGKEKPLRRGAASNVIWFFSKLLYSAIWNLVRAKQDYKPNIQPNTIHYGP